MSEKPKPDANALLRSIVAAGTAKATAQPAASRDSAGKFVKKATSDASAGIGVRHDPVPKKPDSNELLRRLAGDKSY